MTIEQVTAPSQSGIRASLAWLDASIQRRPNLCMYCLLAAGFLVRLWHATGTYLNPDEALHFFVANKVTWGETYRASLNVSHPPLLIFLLRLWRVLGTSELMLRMPSILAGTLFCWFVYRWLRMLFDGPVVWIAFTFMVFLPSSIDLSTEVRQYALLLAFAMGSAYFLERALQENSALAMLASGGFLWLAILSHFSAFLFAGVLGVYAILRMVENRTRLKVLAAWELGQVVALGVCYFLYITQISRLGQAYGGTNATRGWMGNDYLGNSYFIPGRVNPLLFVFARTGGVFQYVFRQSAVGDLAFVLFVVGVVMIFRKHRASSAFGRSSFAKPGPSVLQNSTYTGIFLLLPFVFNCGAALVRAYPYGGTRHSSFLLPFALAAVAVPIARLLKGRVALGIVMALIVSLVCNVFPSKRLPYMSAESQRKSNMTAAITLLRNLPAGEPIFTDYQTSLTLGHYLCDQHPIEQDRKMAGFISYECGGHKIIVTATTFLFTARNFYDQWQVMVSEYGLHPGAKIWVTQMGWSTYLAFELTNFPEFHISPRYFGDNIQVFDLTVGQSMPNPELLPTS
jgi:4-amino-4-deoxy-L-arabinose transferase-like glycosyltransferase